MHWHLVYFPVSTTCSLSICIFFPRLTVHKGKCLPPLPCFTSSSFPVSVLGSSNNIPYLNPPQRSPSPLSALPPHQPPSASPKSYQRHPLKPSTTCNNYHRCSHHHCNYHNLHSLYNSHQHNQIDIHMQGESETERGTGRKEVKDITTDGEADRKRQI